MVFLFFFFLFSDKLELDKFHLTPDGRSAAFLGPHGFVYVIDLASKEIVSTVKMNSNVRDVAFLQRHATGSTTDSSMLTHGDDGFVYVWDFRRTSSCLHKFVDDGCINGSAIGVSPDSRFIACGSASGKPFCFVVHDLHLLFLRWCAPSLLNF